MRNTVTLFDLQNQLRPDTAGRMLHRGGGGAATPATPAPANGTAAPQAPKPPSATRAHAFDFGAPVALQYGDPHTRFTSRPSATSPSARQPWAGMRAASVESFRDDEEVGEPTNGVAGAEPEAFEEEEEAAAPRDLMEPPPADVAGWDGAGGDYVDATRQGGSDDEEISMSRGRTAGAQRASSRYAEQLRDIERDLKAVEGARTPHQTDAAAGDDPPPTSMPAGAHGVFDTMASAMAYANDFRLPAVDLKGLFNDFDSRMDRAGTGAPARDIAAKGAAPSAPLDVHAWPTEAELAADLPLIGRQAASVYNPERALDMISQEVAEAHLRNFKPDELVVTADGALRVFKFFWPQFETTELRAPTDADRGFAQGLLLQAADASHSVGIIETLYRTFGGKVAVDFGDIKDMVTEVAKRAIQDRWFSRITDVSDPAKLVIYEMVRATVAAKHITEYRMLRNGDPVY